MSGDKAAAKIVATNTYAGKELTKKKTQLELDLASPDVYNDKAKFLQTETAYKNNAEEFKKANSAYEIVFEKMMELEEKI